MRNILLACWFATLLIRETYGQEPVDYSNLGMFSNLIIMDDPNAPGLVVIRPCDQGRVTSANGDESTLKNLSIYIDQPKRIECVDMGDRIDVTLYDSLHGEHSFYRTQQQRVCISPSNSFSLGPQNVVVVNGIPCSAREFAKCRQRGSK